MSLSQLKSKIKTFDSTKKVTKAMRNIAASKLTKLKHKLITSNSNIVHLNENLIPPKNINITSFQDNMTRIIFSPAKGMCGGLSRRILNDLLNDSNIKLDSKIINIELPLAKLLAENNFSSVACFIDLEEDNYPIINKMKFILGQ